MDCTIIISGEAGNGMQTIGLALCRILKRAGCSFFADQDYMSRIRGGNNFFRVRFGKRNFCAPREKTDILVALDKQSLSIHRQKISENTLILCEEEFYEKGEFQDRCFTIPLRFIAMKTGGKTLFSNSVGCGAITGILRVDFDIVRKVLDEVFSNKGKTILEKNIQAARAGYQYSCDNFKFDTYSISQSEAGNEIIASGNDAIALGAIHAGCKFYSAYPMTPSTSIMNTLAHFAHDFHIVVEQGEDEISAINMVIGASFNGVRAMTSTSGGGFALMSESLSLAAITETPLVAVEAQRPAPATGLPTRTEQSDLDFIIHAGHGEFARVVYTPGTVEEAFYLTVKAFDMADKFQVPVIIMSDQHLADSYRNITLPDVAKIPRNKYLVKQTKDEVVYRRYELTDSSISPRSVPSWINDVIYVDSHEHTEEGHITEDGTLRSQMVNKRFTNKMKLLSNDIIAPVSSGLHDAEIVLVGFGSTYGVIREARESCHSYKVECIHLPQVWPFPCEQLVTLLDGKRNAKVVTVENNAGGQLARLIMRETGIACDGSILKFDGRPFTVEEIINEIASRY